MNLQTSQAKGLLEFLRLLALSVVSYLLTEGVVSNVLFLFTGDKLSPTESLLISGLMTSILKAFDKALHEKGKEEGDENLTKGITRF